MKLHCDNCGDIDYVLVDGYAFGDRILEGVMFMVADVCGKPKVLGVQKSDEEYFSALNRTRWFKACQRYVKNLDFGICPKCGENVDAWACVGEFTGKVFEDWVGNKA